LKNFISRTITGTFFVSSIIASVILSHIAFAVLFFLMAIFGYWEFQKLVSKESSLSRQLPGLIAAMIVYVIFALFSLSIIGGYSLWLIFPILIILASIHLIFRAKDSLTSITSDISGIVFVVIPIVLLNFYLNPTQIPGYHTPWLLLGMFAILWTHDTFAYLTGSLFGKHPLYKSISPKKSWEGSIGGFGFAIIAAYVISIFSPILMMWHWITLAIIITVFGTIGDLAESLLKRKAGVKDSGNILPGHGGILDRLDSILFVSPIVYLLILLFIS